MEPLGGARGTQNGQGTASWLHFKSLQMYYLYFHQGLDQNVKCFLNFRELSQFIFISPLATEKTHAPGIQLEHKLHGILTLEAPSFLNTHLKLKHVAENKIKLYLQTILLFKMFWVKTTVLQN